MTPPAEPSLPGAVRPRYPNLMSPLQLGAVRLKNRMVMGSIHTRLENEDNGIARLAAFYAARARGGVAMAPMAYAAPAPMAPAPVAAPAAAAAPASMPSDPATIVSRAGERCLRSNWRAFN